ncbi:hypothetical protein [uncultured Culturomica sp.]|jgi:ABC-type lipoprotein export system ATPase subunit|uniref:hypothetical protein n=2 Tax=Odoribacteraceae TaxID=1853231 RepID=UPI000837EA25|nr:hypothetical protein [uncultured Culturomica sp.]RHV98058.1 hypothetical protein DXA95_02425 [Odoribacter sp. OF09-27XD]HBO25422.1 hypothetical protein [Culturomica sp.]
MMKYLLIIIGLLSGTTLWAQNNKLSEEKRDEFEAQKAAFFTQALDLTPQEAVSFWPLYNEMFKKIREKDMEMRKKAKVMRETKNLTEADARKYVEGSLAAEQQMLDIKKQYYQKLLEVIPAKKIAKLDWVERKFHRQLLDKMRKCSQPSK